MHLIRSEAKIAHEALANDLAEACGVVPLHERMPPHLTIKRGFTLDDQAMEVVYQKLDQLVATHTQSDYRLHGLDHFDDKAIYVDVTASSRMLLAIRDLMDDLRNVPGMLFHEYDEIEDDLHATVTMQALKEFDFEQVWKYLQTRQPIDFAMKFDNLTIMRKEVDQWVPERIWELPI